MGGLLFIDAVNTMIESLIKFYPNPQEHMRNVRLLDIHDKNASN